MEKRLAHVTSDIFGNRRRVKCTYFQLHTKLKLQLKVDRLFESSSFVYAFETVNHVVKFYCRRTMVQKQKNTWRISCCWASGIHPVFSNRKHAQNTHVFEVTRTFVCFRIIVHGCNPVLPSLSPVARVLQTRKSSIVLGEIDMYSGVWLYRFARRGRLMCRQP